MSRKRAIVIGAGAIGTASAYYLAKRDWDVTLLDRDRQGAGSTGGNCGLMANCHVLPLNEPGAVGKTLKAMCRWNSPLSIKPRFSPGLWMWLLRFARNCNRKTMMESAVARAALIDSSVALYRELLAEESIECEWEDRGCLFVYRSQKAMERYAETDQLLREEFDVAAVRYDGDALSELEPAIRPGVAAGGWHYEHDSHVRPEKLMGAWRAILNRMGVAIRENCEVTGFVRRNGCAEAVATADGDLSADAFVVATGAWTPQLNRQLGCRVPIQPGKGYSITMPRPGNCPTIPMILQENKVVVTPMQSGYRLGSTMEFSGYDERILPKRLRLLTDGARQYLHEAVAEPVEKEWYGWRPMTNNGKPIIDRSPAMENVVIAAGHNMIGLTLATATGQLVAELLADATPHLDMSPFSLDKFG